MKHGDIVTTNMPNVDLISLVEKDIKGGSQNLKSSKSDTGYRGQFPKEEIQMAGKHVKILNLTSDQENSK